MKLKVDGIECDDHGHDTAKDIIYDNMMASQLAQLLLFVSLAQLVTTVLCFSFPLTIISSDQRHRCRLGVSRSSDEISNDDDIISISIQKQLSDGVTPEQAKDAWMEYHWKKGGGLPILVLSPESTALERTILPTLMKEQILEEIDDDKQGLVEVKYKVTDAGPFFPGIIPNTHDASVKFQSIDDKSTVMNWNVSFASSKEWQTFYETLTQWTVGTAATTVEECVAVPRKLNVRTLIPVDEIEIDPFLARKECLEFVWASGGGLPLIPPIPFGKVMEEGGGSARQNLLRIPPFITESIVDTFTLDDQASFQYRLNRPGWTTIPFLLHTHIGNVSFASTTQGLAIEWEVKIRSYEFVKPIIEKLVEMVVATLVRNLRVKLIERDAVVSIKPPRGNEKLTMGVEEFGKVSKASWLGGVLQAHLSDRRSTIEQTVSLVQPWTWGRSGAGDESDVVQYEWSDEEQ